MPHLDEPTTQAANEAGHHDGLSSLYTMSTTSAPAKTEYAAINSPSVVTLLLGVASVLALFTPILLLIPLAAFLVHEWGHLLGALASGAQVEYPRTPLTVFLFRFDVARSDRRQFLAMSNGGFIASLLLVALLLVVLRPHYRGDAIALALSALGVLATFILEVPAAWKVWRGAPLPTGAAFVGEPPQR